MKGMCLASSGLDSTLAIIKLLEQGHEVYPLFIRYNQWQEKEEEKHIKKVLSQIGLPIVTYVRFGSLQDLITLDLPFKDKVGHSSARPLAFAGLAVMYSDVMGLGIEFVSTGYLGLQPWPESSKEAQNHIEGFLNSIGIQHLNPVFGMTKKQVGIELKKYGVPWTSMYTCYWSPPCGSKSPDDNYLCGGCRNKKEAMISAGETEGTLKPNYTDRYIFTSYKGGLNLQDSFLEEERLRETRY